MGNIRSMFDLLDNVICRFYDMTVEEYATKMEELRDSQMMFVVLVALNEREDKKVKALSILNNDSNS